MAKFNFNLRNPGKLSLCPIYLIIRFDNLKLVYPTQESIPPEHWNATTQRAKASRNFPQYPYFNERLNQIEGTAKKVFTKFLLEHDHRKPTTQELRNELNNEFHGKTAAQLDFLGFIEKFISESNTRTNDLTGKPISKSSKQIYERTLVLLKEYSVQRKAVVDFETIDLDFYFKFVEFLTKEKGFSSNTIGKHIKTLKVFLNDATERGLNAKLSYKSRKFQIVCEDVDKIYLNEKELADVYGLDLSGNKRLERVRDLFIVGCWTGLRFSDLSALSKENIKGDFIHVEMKKTREKVVIPIHKTVKEILEKYWNSSYNGLPNLISNPKMNAYLKELKDKVPCLQTEFFIKRTKGGLEFESRYQKGDLVTVHTARRSFATNLYLSKFPVISIMKITGHQSEKAFLQYIRITPNENAELLKKHWDRLFHVA